MHVLVAYGSKMGGTAGIAELIGDALTDAGLQADVRPVAEVSQLDRTTRWSSAGRCTAATGTARPGGSSGATPMCCGNDRCGCSAAAP